ncbi:zinc finger protein 37-like [Polistes fuscatus]|uniref:zinc finger protein 37-like n=1 Tax=Polistes fuscatus TaxID=30207 RepID=UPI001CA97787|nr:zinc finger protein 37-like [Polistes fuscatus]
MNLKEANVISILEKDAWLFSNNLEMENIVNVTDDFVKDYDFSTISSEVNNETSNGFTETLSDSICIRMNKEEQYVNPQMTNLDSHILKLILLGAEDTISCMSFQCDSRNNKELLKLQSEENMLALNDLCNTRNLPNILRGPKTYSKRNKFSFPFETEDNSYYTNEITLEHNIFVEENTKTMEKSHRKRKQKHDPLIVKEESINWVINSTSDCDNSSKKKRKFNSRKAVELNCSNKGKKKRERKSFLMKKVNSKQPVNETSRESNVTSDSTVSILEQDKGRSNDVDISLDFITFHEEQIHEDYTDHFDILTDIIKEQVLNDNCYDINSDTIYSSNILDYQKLECQKSPKHNVVNQVENSSENKNIISTNDISSDCKDCFHHKSKNCLLFGEYSETRHVNNYFSSYFNDSLDNSLDGPSCQEHSTHNFLQNSLNKDKTQHLDSLLLKDEEKYKAYLESKLNNDLTFSNSNFLLTNASKSTTHDYLSNNLEDSTIVKQKSNTQQSVQFDVLPDTDLSAKVLSDSKDISLTDSLENDMRLEEVVQEKKRTKNNKYILVHKLNEELELECDYKEKNDNSNHIKKVKEDIKETLQCLLCPLTFPSKRSLALHVSGAHGDMYMILCERCGRLFNKKCVFNNHYIYCGCVKLPFNCNKCNKSYKHKSSLIYHLKIVHKVDYKNDKMKEYKCDVCSKTYRKYGAFEKHLGIHINSTKSLNLRDKNCTLIVTV